MYTFKSDWRHWVCVISQTKKAVNLRFLYGALLSDPAVSFEPARASSKRSTSRL